MFTYNTTCPPPTLKFYGKNIQNLVEYILTIKDKAQRTAHTHTLLALMQSIHPSSNSKAENTRKLLSDIFIMSNYQLNIDTPYPMLNKATLTKQPNPMLYPKNILASKYYGSNISNLIQQIASIKDTAIQEELLVDIVKLMWSLRKNSNIDLILDHIKQIAGKNLTFDLTILKNKPQLVNTKKYNFNGKKGFNYRHTKARKKYN